MTTTDHVERVRQLAVRHGYSLTSRPRMNGELSGDLCWLSRLGELPVLDGRYACDLADIERVLTGDLPGFGVVPLLDRTAGRTVWLVCSRIASVNGVDVHELPSDGLAVAGPGGLVQVHPDLEAFVNAGYGLELTAAVVWTVTGVGVAAP